jgi:hypothetical protein
MPEEWKCAVCQNELAVGVACIPGIPMSVAYGRTCLEAGAHPSWALRANVACCGGVDAVIPEYLESLVYEDAAYITLRKSINKRPLEDFFGPEPDREEKESL